MQRCMRNDGQVDLFEMLLEGVIDEENKEIQKDQKKTVHNSP